MEVNKIQKIWTNSTLKKIFLDILCNTQLHKCKQLKNIFIKKMNQIILNNANISDNDVYDKMHIFIHKELHIELRSRIQHKEQYRISNRANKLIKFIDQYKSGVETPSAILDIGCDDGEITNVVGNLLNLSPVCVHGSDLIPTDEMKKKKIQFTYHCADEQTGKLPFDDNTIDVVYAFMSLHHIHKLDETLTEIYRILKPSGLFIIREHDLCESLKGYGDVLDVVHGFYNFVWSNPQEPIHNSSCCHYFSSSALQQKITACGLACLLSTHNTSHVFPSFFKGKVINPLRHYYAVYKK